MKLWLGVSVWLLAASMSYLVGDIAFGSDISVYADGAGLTIIYVAGALAVAAFYSCWYLFRRDNKLTDIAVPACLLLIWAFVRRRTLRTGGRIIAYSIGYEINKTYGLKWGLVDIDGVPVYAVAECIVFIMAVAMFFSSYMIFRYGSMTIALALTLVFMAGGAALSVDAGEAGTVMALTSLIVCRYILVHEDYRISAVRDVVLPVCCLAACMAAAFFVYGKMYERGTLLQPRLIELTDRLEAAVTGNSRKGYSGYYKVDGEAVNPTDEVAYGITREELPEGNLYITSRRYVEYNDGVWSVRDIGYSPDSKAFVSYDAEVFSRLYEDVRMLVPGDYVYSDEFREVITDYIRGQMSYTTTPAEFDADTDPVMYAMYEGHEGYCVHFASAAAIAFRCLHIPSRYNVGYMIPESAWRLLDDGMYHADVLDKYSHAWAEVYDEETDKWVIVDATPHAESTEEDGATGRTDSSDSKDMVGGDQKKEEPDATQQVTEQQATESQTGEQKSDANKERNEKTQDMQEQDGQQETENVWKGGRCLALICAVLALLSAVFLRVRRQVAVFRRRHAFVGADRIGAIYEMSQEIYRLLEFAQPAEHAGDDDEYAKAVTESCRCVEGDEFERFIERVQAAVYGGIVPDDEEMLESLKLYRKLALYMYWSLNFRKRFVWKYIRCYDIPRLKK